MNQSRSIVAVPESSRLSRPPLATPDRCTRRGGCVARRALLACWTLLAAACASAPVVEDLSSAEEFYNEGLEILKGRKTLLFFHTVDYSEAIARFQEVIDSYPYSEYATLAEIQLADIHFDRKQYEEASSYYEDFVELHPRHPQVPYALYRKASCGYEQMRSSDRDPTPTHAAVEDFRTLIGRFPEFERAAEAREKLTEAENRLARREIEIGDFYFEDGDYHAAVGRYREALSRYPDHSDRARTLSRLGLALARLHRREEADQVLRQALAENPDRSLRRSVESELAAMNAGAGLGLQPGATAR